MNEGRHGVVCDSLSVRWDAVAKVAGTNAAPRVFSGILVQPDPAMGPTEGRDWTIVEMIDRVQIWKDTVQTLRSLQAECASVRIGRGRVSDEPYNPVQNCNVFPYRAPPVLFGNNLAARNRVTCYRGTALNQATAAIAQENVIGGDPIYVLDNYRVYVTEGRPVQTTIADYAFVSSRAELDIPITSTGYALQCTPVPDFAVGLRVTAPIEAVATGLVIGVAWIDVFGDRFPASAAAYQSAPIAPGGSNAPLAVPWWASSMHLFNASAIPGPALTYPIQIAWEILQ